MSTSERTPAQRIVDDHVKCNVTPLISLLLEHDDDFARDLMLGTGEGAYDAYEVWIVSEWLGRQLQQREHRVEQYWSHRYWARGATGQAIYMDDVIEEIAKATIRAE